MAVSQVKGKKELSFYFLKKIRISLQSIDLFRGFKRRMQNISHNNANILANTQLGDRFM